MVTEVVVETHSPKKQRSPKKGGVPKFGQKTANEEKKDLLAREFEMIKFLWQIYQLKVLVCPNLSRNTQDEEN